MFKKCISAAVAVMMLTAFVFALAGCNDTTPGTSVPDTTSSDISTDAPDVPTHECSGSVVEKNEGTEANCTATVQICEICGKEEVISYNTTHEFEVSEPAVVYNDDGVATAYSVTHTCQVCGWSYIRKLSDEEITDAGLPPVHSIPPLTSSSPDTSVDPSMDPSAEPSADPGLPPDTQGDKNCKHVYKDDVTKPTCTTAGYTTHTCTVCGHSYSDGKRKALGHSYGEWTTTKNPTCDTNGVKSHTCTRCDHTETKAISATGHQWGEGKTTTAPSTCSDIGVTTYTCSVCGKTKTEKVEGNHAFGEWLYEEYTIKLESPARPGHFATFTGRKKYRVCSKCNKKEYDNSIKQHACNTDIYKVVRKADCSHEGLNTYECSVCGFIKEYPQPIEPGLHSAWSTRTEHLCDASYEYDALDVTIVDCADCGYHGYAYEFNRSETLRGKKTRVTVGCGIGDSYAASCGLDDTANEGFVKHPTWQTVIRDIKYDSEGYVIQFTVIWHDNNGKVYSEAVDCSSVDAMLKYFPSDFVEQYRNRKGSWNLEPRGSRLAGRNFTYSGMSA